MQECFVPSLVEIGLVLQERKMKVDRQHMDRHFDQEKNHISAPIDVDGTMHYPVN